MERSKSLSIKAVKSYKFFLISIVSVLFITYVVIYATERGIFGIIAAATYIVLMMFYWFPNLKKFLNQIKEVAYDKENLYVKEGDYEIQIPFYKVKDIEILSLDGLYKFKLYHHDQFGNEVICKPSIWYPLNYKKVDAELSRIRSLVRKAHREYVPEMGNERTLPSN